MPKAGGKPALRRIATYGNSVKLRSNVAG